MVRCRILQAFSNSQHSFSPFCVYTSDLPSQAVWVVYPTKACLHDVFGQRHKISVLQRTKALERVVILVSLRIRFRVSGVMQVVDLLLCPFFQGLLKLREVVLRLLQNRLVYLELLWCGREGWVFKLPLDFVDFSN